MDLETFFSWPEAADHTNLHRHARHNAQEAVVLAKKRVQAFDAQAALERKTNHALQLAKSQAHVRDDEEEQPAKAPLVDRKRFLFVCGSFSQRHRSGLGRTELPKSDFAQWTPDYRATSHADGSTEGVSTKGPQLVSYAI
jgi:hypothetical protein